MLKLCISGLVHINVVKKPHLLYSVYDQKLLLVYQFGVSVFKMHFLHTQKEVFKGMMVVRVFFFIKILVGFVHLVTRAKKCCHKEALGLLVVLSKTTASGKFRSIYVQNDFFSVYSETFSREWGWCGYFVHEDISWNCVFNDYCT